MRCSTRRMFLPGTESDDGGTERHQCLGIRLAVGRVRPFPVLLLRQARSRRRLGDEPPARGLDALPLERAERQPQENHRFRIVRRRKFPEDGAFPRRACPLEKGGRVVCCGRHGGNRRRRYRHEESVRRSRRDGRRLRPDFPLRPEDGRRGRAPFWMERNGNRSRGRLDDGG